MGLTTEQILELLTKAPREFPPPIAQRGPVRWFDTTKPCYNGGCRSPTFLEVQHKRRCMKHAIEELNLMLINFGVEE